MTLCSGDSTISDQNPFREAYLDAVERHGRAGVALVVCGESGRPEEISHAGGAAAYGVRPDGLDARTAGGPRRRVGRVFDGNVWRYIAPTEEAV